MGLPTLNQPALEFLSTVYDNRLPTRDHTPSIVEYAETTIVPSGKYRGLPFRHNRAPQLVEPLQLLSPDSPYADIIFMTPAQFGKSTLAELTVMYYITQVPSEILYASSNETAAIKWLERRIVPRAHAAGIQFQTEIENRNKNKSGNTAYSKLFPGGNIDIASALSPAQLASETKRICIGDEVDRWKQILGAEGSVVDMIKARTLAWGSQARRLWISTPTTIAESLIYAMFIQGDQRYYWVPCPYCGTMQLMDFEAGRGHGLVWEIKDGRINKKSIELICENQTCGRGIRESSRPKMLRGGQWRPSAVAQYETMASFTANGLYSHMLSWYEMVESYLEAEHSAVKKQAHENLRMGRPHIDKGSRPKAEKLVENRGNYRKGTVPEGVLYLTMFVDVQRGSAKDVNNPPRLEFEICGIGYAYKTWSIDYVVISGEISDPFSEAWEKLHQYALSTGLTYTREIDGFKFPVSLIFIDSGDGEYTDVVYQFCQRWENTFPSKGFKSLKKRKNESPDELTESSFKRYRPVKVGESITLYEISTVYYKNQLYNALKVPRLPADPQKPGFCDFPRDYDAEHFERLTAEEKLADGSFVNNGRRNEQLDCRVGCLCAADVFLDAELQIFRDHARANGMPKDQLMLISHRAVIDEMIRQTSVKKIEKNKKS